MEIEFEEKRVSPLGWIKAFKSEIFILETLFGASVYFEIIFYSVCLSTWDSASHQAGLDFEEDKAL